MGTVYTVGRELSKHRLARVVIMPWIYFISITVPLTYSLPEKVAMALTK